MTRDDMIRMAREARGGTTWWPIHVDILERFAALVAAAEREACARLCDDYDDDRGVGETWGPRFAEMIRARGAK